MALKTKTIEVDGQTLNLKELSFAAQIRLRKIGDYSELELFKEMMNEEDFNKLELISSKSGTIILDAFAELIKIDKVDIKTAADVELKKKEDGSGK
jgi:hypothetical protein